MRDERESRGRKEFPKMLLLEVLAGLALKSVCVCVCVCVCANPYVPVCASGRKYGAGVCR